MGRQSVTGGFLQHSPAFRVSLYSIFGILLGKWIGWSSNSLALAALLLLLTSSVLTLIAGRRANPSGVLTVLITFLCMCLGAAKIAWDGETNTSLPDSLITEDVVIVGKVIDSPHAVDGQLLFPVECSYLLHRTSQAPFSSICLVKMRNALREGGVAMNSHGWWIALRGRLEKPSESRNPGEFNQRRYYEASGISWLFRVRNTDELVVLDSLHGSWLMNAIVIPARMYILNHIDATIGGQEGEFLKGIIIGERGGLSFDVREAFAIAGVSHILAVSGSNVAFVAAMVFFGFELLRIPAQLRVVSACAAVLLYMLLVGNQPPVMRATIMALIFFLGRLLEEKPNPINSLGVSALILLGIDARQLFDVGFQLSFAAVFSIIYFYPKINTLISRLSPRSVPGRLLISVLRICAVSFVATLGTLPLTAGYFGRVSAIGLVENIFVVPAAGAALMLGFVSTLASAISGWLGEVYAAVNQLLLSLTLKLTVYGAGLPFAAIDTFRYSFVDALPYYAGVWVLFHIDRKRMACRLLILFAVTLDIRVFVGQFPSSGILRVSFIDVGQGDAALIELPDGRTILVDTGPWSEEFDSGDRVVVPFLKRSGVSKIDLLVITHPHNDHMGGAAAVLREFPVLSVVDCGRDAESLVFRQYRDCVQKEENAYVATQYGDLIDEFQGVRLYVLSPPPIRPHEKRESSDVNNSSVVLRVLYGHVSFLLAGDAEQEAEHGMVSRYGNFLESTLLKVGHHGSSTSSTDEFVNSVRPKYAVISVGRWNRFGHPSKRVLQRFADRGVDLSRTDEEGAVLFETDGFTLEHLAWR